MTMDKTMDKNSFVEFFKDGSSWDPLQLEELIETGADLNAPLSLEDGSRPLHVAAKKGDVEVVRILLDHGAYVDVPDYYGNTPAHYASSYGHNDVLKLLVDRDSNVNLKNDKGCTILDNVVCNEDLEMTRLLVSKGVNTNDAESSLFHAVEKENVEIAKELLEAGVKIKHNLMQKAVKKGNVELARLLVENGAEIGGNYSYLIVGSPFEVAIKCGNLKMVLMLLENQIIINNKVHMNEYLSMALEMGQCEIAKLLCEKGAEVPCISTLCHALTSALKRGCTVDTVKFILEMSNTCIPEPSYQDYSDELDDSETYSLESEFKRKSKNDFDDTLHSAIVLGNVEIIQLLLARVTDLNIRNEVKKTPLILATEKALIQVIKLLLERGADVTLCDDEGKTALYYALLQKDYFHITEALLNGGASVNDIICSKSKTTPLHLAASTNKIALIEFLLQKKANVNTKDLFGNSPLHALFENNSNVETNNLITCAKKLLEEEGNLDCSNHRMTTPMMKAIESCSSEVLGMFLDAAFSISKDHVLSIITPKLLQHMILNGHIALLKVVLNKVVNFHIEDLMQLGNITSMEILHELRSQPSNSVNDNSETNLVHLHYAAYVGDIRLAETALEYGVNIDQNMSKQRLSPLQVAIYKCNFEMAKFLVGRGANIFVTDKYHLLPLQLAILLGDTSLVKELYDKSCHLVSSVFEIPLLNLAAYHGNVNLVDFIFTKLPDINTRDQNMNTVLHIAVRVHSNELANFCIENGVDINAKNSLGDTVLHTALKFLDESKSCDFEIAVNLLNQGVDINVRNKEKNTCLHLALSQNFTSLIGILLEKGVKHINATNSKGHTAFEQLVLNIKDEKHLSCDVTSLVVLFLKYEAGFDRDLDSVDDDILIDTLLKCYSLNLDRIILECFPKWNSWENSDDEYSWYDKEKMLVLRMINKQKKFGTLELLLNQGFSFNRKVTNNLSLFQLIYHHSWTDEMTKFIIKKDRTVKIEPDYLFKAIEEADLEMVKILLDKLDVNTTDYAKRSTLQNALMCRKKQSRRYGLAQLFLDRGVSSNGTGTYCDPLVEAAQDRNWSMVNILLDKGADINAPVSRRQSALVIAVQQGNVNAVISLLERGAVTNTSDSFDKRTSLHHAAFQFKSKITELLLEKGARHYLGDRSNKTPLHLAAENGNHEVVELLLKAGAMISAKDNAGDTPLHKTKSFKVAEILIREGAPVNAKNLKNQTPLHLLHTASKSAKTLKDIIELLIQSGALVNEQDIEGLSPLHYAAKECDLDSVSVLVSKGAKLDMEDHKGWTPLHHAVFNDRSKIVEHLLKQGASPEVEDTKGDTPVLLASRINSYDSLCILIRHGAKLNVQDQKGWTPLHYAVYNNVPKNVETLLDHGAILEMRNKEGQTPLLLAGDNKRIRYDTTVRIEKTTESLKILIGAGVSIDAKDNSGNTALHYAVNDNSFEVMKCLVHNGASTNVENNYGQTPYQLCRNPVNERFFINYIQLSKLAGLSTDDNLMSEMNEKDKTKALKELDSLKVTEVKEGFYLIDIFSNVDNPSYLLDEDTMEQLNTIFQAPDFHTKFPAYADILESTVLKLKRSRYYLLKTATRSMMSVNRKICCQITPDLVWDYVFGFLNLQDLIKVIRSDI